VGYPKDKGPPKNVFSSFVGTFCKHYPDSVDEGEPWAGYVPHFFDGGLWPVMRVKRNANKSQYCRKVTLLGLANSELGVFYGNKEKN
tara:strand:- start:288 stop:548 length:261 start_codon:yes stop_codon:yes gene_type:complete